MAGRSGGDAVWCGMDQDSRRLYKALTSRDSRFDGIFFVGVTSTDIYCRPICPAKTPKAANCRFFDTPQEAEQAGFRPCLRCRPELAPGSAPVDDAQRIAQLIVQRLEEGQLGREGRARGDRRRSSSSARGRFAASSTRSWACRRFSCCSRAGCCWPSSC